MNSNMDSSMNSSIIQGFTDLVKKLTIELTNSKREKDPSSKLLSIKLNATRRALQIIKDFPEQVEHHATEPPFHPRRRRVRVPDQQRIDRKRDRIRRERMASRSVGPRGPNNYIGGESM